MNPEQIDDTLAYFDELRFQLEQFLVGVTTFFSKNPKLNSKDFPIVHTIKSRFKDREHLRDKILRKLKYGIIVNRENLLTEINDLIGVRVLHIYQDQFVQIHDEIMGKIGEDWVLVEPPIAYTWDPELTALYSEKEIETQLKESYYTSVHYVIKPNNKSLVSCEVQVRTLFEEIWGEIDHSINYPYKTSNVHCSEQLKVLSSLVATGTRLANSIYRSHNISNGESALEGSDS